MYIRPVLSRAAIVAALTAVSAGAALANSWSAFNQWDSISGVGVAYNGVRTFTVSLAPGATMVVGGTTYNITKIFGFFSLDADGIDGNGNDLIADGSDFTDGSKDWVWVTDNDHAHPADSVGGWEGNPAQEFIPPDQQFTYNSSPAFDVTRVASFGFHMMYYNPTITSGTGSAGTPYTAYFKGPTDGHGHPRFEVPEPVTSSLMGASAIMFLRRRMRKRTA